MDNEILRSAAIISAIVSLLVTLATKLFENAIGAWRETRKIKNELQSKLIYDSATDKRKVYKEFVASIYKLRNIIRRFLGNHENFMNSSMFSALQDESAKLEEMLYEEKTILDEDGTFKEIHGFKNETINFLACLRNIKANRSKDVSDDSLFLDDLQESGEEIERLYMQISENVRNNNAEILGLPGKAKIQAPSTRTS